MKNKNRTIGNLLEEARTHEEKAKKIRKELETKQQEFADRYNDNILKKPIKSKYFIGISAYSLNQIRPETIRKKVKAVKFLLSNSALTAEGSIKAREILKGIRMPVWETHILNGGMVVSPVVAQVMGSCQKGYYIKDTKLAELWLKYMEELI